MRISELLRNITFWSLDFIKGSKIKKHFDDLKLSFADIESGRKKAEQRLTGILDHAVKTTPFYKKYAGFENLKDFPVIQKNTIKENYDAFLSDIYDRDKLFKTTTSGSYGTPFTFLLSPEKRNRAKRLRAPPTAGSLPSGSCPGHSSPGSGRSAPGRNSRASGWPPAVRGQPVA